MTDNSTNRPGRDRAPKFRRHAGSDASSGSGRGSLGGGGGARGVAKGHRSRAGSERRGEDLSEDEWRARRRPESIQEIVDRFMDKVGGGRAAPAALLAASWADVVGLDFAAKTRPGSCDAGRLVVLVADGATASKMRFLTSQILQRATQIVGADTVTSISFRVTPNVG